MESSPENEEIEQCSIEIIKTINDEMGAVLILHAISQPQCIAFIKWRCYYVGIFSAVSIIDEFRKWLILSCLGFSIGLMMQVHPFQELINANARPKCSYWTASCKLAGLKWSWIYGDNISVGLATCLMEILGIVLFSKYYCVPRTHLAESGWGIHLPVGRCVMFIIKIFSCHSLSVYNMLAVTNFSWLSDNNWVGYLFNLPVFAVPILIHLCLWLLLVYLLVYRRLGSTSWNVTCMAFVAEERGRNYFRYWSIYILQVVSAIIKALLKVSAVLLLIFQGSWIGC